MVPWEADQSMLAVITFPFASFATAVNVRVPLAATVELDGVTVTLAIAGADALLVGTRSIASYETLGLSHVSPATKLPLIKGRSIVLVPTWKALLGML